jgi:hypothetical protein
VDDGMGVVAQTAATVTAFCLLTLPAALAVQVVGIFSLCDQSNDRLWEYARCATNQMTDHENILAVRPIK